MAFYGPTSHRIPIRFPPNYPPQAKHRVTASLIIILLMLSMFVVTLPVTEVAAQPDGFEYFVHSETDLQRIDDDMDGYFETARLYYDVDSTTVYAEIKVVCKVTDLNTSKLVKELSDTYTIFRNIDIKETFFDFKTSYTGVFNFSLTVYDVRHNHQEYGNNVYPAGTISLEINPYRYQLIADATSYDADGDGYNDDVRVKVTDTYNRTLSDVPIYVNGEFEGNTNQDGIFLDFNLPRGIHEVDAFYGGLHANTDFKSEGTGEQVMAYADADPLDDDFDGYYDDVVIKAYAYNYYPLPNADVYIDWMYYGTTNQQGILYAYNFAVGFHNVVVMLRNLWADTTFYAEGMNETEVHEYFFNVYARVVALDADGLANDIDIYLDVDVPDGKTSNVTVNTTIYYENYTVAAMGSINYNTTGTEIENEHIYIYNLTNNLTYFLICELFDEAGNLEDTWYQGRLIVQTSYGNINVDNFVLDLDNDNHFNDVIFQAHIKDVGYTTAYVKVYWEINNSLVTNLTTSREGGFAVIEDLGYYKYNWTTYDSNNEIVDNGTFILYDRNPFRTVQIRVQLFDNDYDGFFDDFEVLAFNDLDVPENNVSVQVFDISTQKTIASGFTNLQSSGGMRRFLAEDLPEGYYTYTASITFPVGTPNSYVLSTGWLYSYGNSTESTHNLNAFGVGIDADSDGYKNDGRIRVTDRNGQPVMNAIVFFDNNVTTQGTTDQNGIYIGKNFTLGWHDVDVVFLGISPTVPTGSRAYTRFYSEGLNYDEFFWYVDSFQYNADADDEWNDINISMIVGVWENVNVDVTVKVEIYNSSTDYLVAQKSINFTVYGYFWPLESVVFKNVTYNRIYHANLTLRDQNNLVEEEANETNIIIVPIKPIVNVELNLNYYPTGDPPGAVQFYAHIINNGIENVTIEIYNKSNGSKIVELVTDENGYTAQLDLNPTEYYFRAINSTQSLIEYGEFNIGSHPANIQESENDYDNDGYYNDMNYYAYLLNITIIIMRPEQVNVTIKIYDSTNALVAQGDTNNTDWTYTAINFTEGVYRYIATHEGQLVCNGTFYSYGNGYVNVPPVPKISKPVDASSWLTTDLISFDGTSSFDPDAGDVITFYWESNISGALGHTDSFKRRLPAGMHKITLYVSDGREPEHNVTDFVTITVSAPTSPNTPPTADAGADQDNVPVNTTVTLDGSGSDDLDGNITDYEWSLDSTNPPGLSASLNDSHYVQPHFKPNKIGKYTWKLRVKDDDDAWSGYDYVNITVIENRIPIVNISSPGQLDIFNTTDIIFFESNGTYDPDDDLNGSGTIDGSEQDNLTYTWTIWRRNETGNKTTIAEFSGKGKSSFNSTEIDPGLEPGTHFVNLTVYDDLLANASTEVEFNITNVPPVANITSPTEGKMFRKFKDISLDGSASEDPDNETADLHFYWEIEKVGEEPIIISNFSKPTVQLDEGDYTITLWVDDSFGIDLFNREHNVSTIVNITVENQAPVPKFSMYYPNVDYPNTINDGDMAFFDASESSDPDGARDVANFTYTWDFGDESPSTTGITVNHTYMNLDPEEAIYNVTLNVTDTGSDYNNSATTYLLIRVNNLPNADAGDDIEDVLVNEEVQLDGSGSWDLDDDDILRYKWTFDEDHSSQDTDWSTDTTASVTYNKPGNFTVTLNVTDGMGWHTDTLIVRVIKANSRPVCEVGDDITDVDVDQEVSFSGANCYDPDTGDVLTYSWDFGDDTTTTGLEVTHKYTDNGIFTVTLNITDGELYANDNLTVTVRPQPATIDSPEDGETVFSEVTITGTTTGSDITEVEVKIGSKPWADATDISSAEDFSEWAYTWDTTQEDNEEFTIQVRVKTDYATSSIQSINVIVSNAEPLSITITSPSDKTRVSKTETIRGTASGEGITSVEIKIGTQVYWELATPTSGAGDWSEWSFEWDTTAVDNGIITITARVKAGTDSAQTSISLNVQNGEPTEPDETEEAPSGIMDWIRNNLMLVGAALLILIIMILLIIGMISRSRKKRKFMEREAALERIETEVIAKEALEVEKAVVPEEELVKKQPVRCPKCKEYSVIEDDGQRPLMIECVHCGAKGYISDKPKLLSEPKLPAEEEEDKLIIQCPKCEEMFTVEDEIGDIVCPNCGVGGHLDEETLEELRAQRELAETEPDLTPPEKPTEPGSEELEGKAEKKLRCPNCSTKFSIAADATEIECPSCGASGTL